MSVVDFPRELVPHGRRSVGFAPGAQPAPRVALTAWDVVTAWGGLDETWAALLGGHFVRDHTRCGADPDGRPRALALAQKAVERVVRAGLDAGAALVVGTSKGTVESWLEPEGQPTGAGPSAAGIADIAAAVGHKLSLRGPRLTVSAACASGLHALVRGAMMIQSGEVRQALVVASEASVHPLFLGSFQRLGVLAKPDAGCRPFDQNRAGFLMSEAAAAVLLEAADPNESPRPAGRGSASTATGIHLDRYALAADATHLTGSDPEARVLRYVLSRVIDHRPVDLVHAHGTGTPLNDASELAAVESAVADGGTPPALYSHKGALGHSLGAAGLASVVLNCQAHAAGVVPPNVQTRDPLPTRRVVLSREALRRPVRRSVAVAAGFGGAVAAVSLCSDAASA